MKSLANQFKENNLILSDELYQGLIDFESAHYKMKNEHSDLKEECEELKYSLKQIRENDENALTDISKKLSKVLKNEGEKELIAQFSLNRARIMDHFTMAYIAELKLKPSQVKLVQGVNEEGFIEMFFEKHSNLILPDSLK